MSDDTITSTIPKFLVDSSQIKLAAEGAEVIPPTREPGHMLHAPYALVPRSIPAECFQLAYQLADPFNRLIDSIARNPAWIIAVLERTGTVDAFTGKLLDIYKHVLAEGIRQPVSLGIFRSDYMIDLGADGSKPPRLLQIEINTISSAFAGLAAKVSKMHRFLRDRYSDVAFIRDCVGSRVLPENNSLRDVAKGIAYAHNLYDQESAVVMFVVQANERNIMDQRLIELELWKRHGIKCIRKTLEEVHATAKLRDLDGALLCSTEEQEAVEVSVVYFRAGYSPDDYKTDACWAARLLIERSKAVKCPTIAYHLCGTKKVQQVLALPGQLERFVDAETAEIIRRCFAGLWSLDSKEETPETVAAIEAALAEPENFVIKPQREGGGNNIYGADVRKALAGGMSSEEKAAHILMERIRPSTDTAVAVRQGSVLHMKAVSEMGVYGVVVSNSEGVMHSWAAGHLLRTKAENTDEGGVAAGFAVLDSPALV